jgi:hypothetical protein
MRPALLLLLITAAAFAAQKTVVVEASADTYIDAKEPGKNFAPAMKLELSGNEKIALLHFDLSAIPASAVVSSARVALAFDIPKDQVLDAKFTVCDLNKDFQESEATSRLAAKNQLWAAPGLMPYRDYGADSLGFCSSPIRLRNPGPASADMTGFVRMAVDSHRKSVNLAVLASPGNLYGGSIDSRRSTDAALRPKLAIEFNPAAPKAVSNHPFVETKFGPVNLDAAASANADGSKTALAYLWTVDRPAPASTFSPGQELGRAAKLKFEPDVPGLWQVRLRVTNTATKEFSETTVPVTDVLFHDHPRLGLDDKLLGQINTLRATKRPEWTRFEEWLRGSGGVAYGSESQGRLLGYVITGNKAYFNVAWKMFAPQIYVNGKDRSKGLRPFYGTCPQADFCEDHDAGTSGAFLVMYVAYLYDWGFKALTAPQRADLIDWLNAATEFNYLHNSFMHAHFRNDAAILTASIAAVAYATYGENRGAMVRLNWFRREWEHSLEALDVIGRGGALGEGNAYDEVTAGFFITLANFVYYASGENLFYSHPWFQRHLAYEAFSTYPNQLREADDPIGHDNPPNPFPEGAALGGDDNRGASWHSFQLRPNGLALSRRFPHTEESEIWNWVFRQRDDPPYSDPWAELYLYSPRPPLTKPKRLSFFDPSMGYVYLRSDWNSRDATWISSWAGPHVDIHQHLDQGAFSLFKRRDLAAKTGNYDYTPVKPHFLSYYTRTVSSNGLLIGDPNEYFSTFIGYWGCDGAKEHDLFATPDGTGKVCIPNDGGERTAAPYSMSIFSNDDYQAHKQDYDFAKATGFSDNGEAVTWVDDITNAYNNPEYTTPGNQPKVTKVYRKFVYLREADVLLIADTVESTNPNFEKSWLIHSVDQLEAGGTVKQLDPGESIHTGTDRARIVVDDQHPSNQGEVTADLRAGYAALQIETLYPEKFQYDIIGGREPAATAHPQQFQTDPKVLEPNHLHRHIKDFWVKDYSEGVQPDHRSLNWPPVFPQETQMADKLPTFIGGYGRWRLEIHPTVPSKNDYFLNVLKPTLETGDSMPAVTKFETTGSFGASIISGGKTYKVTFSKETLDPPVVEGMDLRAPVISSPKPIGQLASGTHQAAISVTTDEPSSCRFSYRAGTMYPFMTGNFQSADGLTHTTVNRDLNNGDTYTYFVRCMDKSGNENLEDLRIRFSVAH